jgi:hypothetical protein
MRSRRNTKKIRFDMVNGFRKADGSVLPFIAFSMAVVVACVAFSVDVTRNIVAVRKLEFAADAAGLYAYAHGVSADGTYNATTANSNMASALSVPNGATTLPWNEAPSGPQSSQGPWNTAVAIDGSDVSFVQNPADSQETFLRLTARRQGTDALKQFFMPAIRAFDTLGSSTTTTAQTTVEPYRTTEIVGQPACRIGMGAPRTGQSVSDLAGFAVFPLAISNVQFQPASSPTVTNKNYVIDLISSQNLTASALPFHMQAAFVNVGSSGGTVTYYGSGQGNQAIDQLISLLKYFYAQPDGNATSPQAVERGISIPAFDAADATFTTRKTALINVLQQLQTAPRTLILPVVASAPQAFPASLKVVGFARMSIVQLVNTAGDDFAITLKIEDSVALPNATCGNNLVSIPQMTGATMPPAVSPFRNRTYASNNNSLSVRQRGVVLAPALSPRDLKAS